MERELPGYRKSVLTLLILSTLLYGVHAINSKLTAIPSSSTNYKNDKNKNNLQLKMKYNGKSFATGSLPKRLKVVQPRYQDVADLVEMDYSRPRMKTPIHN
ncbi:uncharacterized protein LOC110944859 [Helianthus annuus]|uniref:uncharacterized protein LOC110944859 n=1 Tax=Helianthus annuus TaxID=4232 RepID=UPI000B8F8B08|nr:uncharacterized protein LOC110944859 [Helianthus annuus]